MSDGELIRLVQQTCPHCGARRAPDDGRCTECGLARPAEGWHRDPLQGASLPDPAGWTLVRRLDSTPEVSVYEAQGPSGGGYAFVGRTAARAHEMANRNQALLGLHHPQVTGVLGVGQVKGFPYRLDARGSGPSAQVYLERVGALPPWEVMDIGLGLAQVLIEVHSRGLVHGNVCLKTVRLDSVDGGLVPVLCDFPGLHEAGIEPHAAPEVQLGKQPDPRADLFGLGYVLVSLLRGAPTDGAEGRAEDWLLKRPGPAMQTMQHLPAGFEELIKQLVDREASRRPRSAAEVADVLARLRGSAADTRDFRLPLVGGLGLLALAALGAAIFFFRDGRDPELGTPISDAVAELEDEIGNEVEIGNEIEDEIEVPVEAPVLAERPRAEVPRSAESSVKPPLVEEAPVEEPSEEPEPAVAEVAPPPVEEAAVEEASVEEPPPEAAPAGPDASGLSGAWAGTANKRPFKMQLSVTPEGRVSGHIEVQVGSNYQKRSVSGSVDPDSGALTLVEAEGQRPSTYSGTLKASGGSGSIVLGGKARGDWSVSR